MFGNFNLNAGLSQLQDLGGRFQKIKEDLEQNIESSLRTNIAPAAGGNTGDDSGAAISSADGSVAFGESWEGYSLSAASARGPTAELQKQGSQSPQNKPATASLSSEQAESQPALLLSASGDAGDQPQSPNPSAYTENEARQLPTALEPPESTQQLGQDIHSTSIDTSQQQQDSADSEALQITERQQESTDHAAPSTPDAQTAENEHQHGVTNLDSFGSLIETRPESNGISKPLQSAEAGVPASTLVEPTSPGTAPAAADDQSDDAQSLGGASAQSVLVHDEQQLQQPLSGLYLSSQVDQSSRDSLPESVQSAESSLQQPAISSSIAEDNEPTEAVTASQANGVGHEGEESALELAASASQQSSQDNHEQQAQPPEMVNGDVEVEAMSKEAVCKVVQGLQAGLQARERQLERQGQQLAAMQEVQHQLQVRNEELVVKAAKVSEEDMAAVQAECERRLGAAERKVYALVKERDALRRGSDKLSSAHDLLKEKDSIIAQVMEEGERLSIKQGNMESTIKKLRGQVKELEASQTQAAAKLAAEEGKLEAATKVRQKAEAATAAAQQQHKAESEQQKQHYEGLLKQSRTSQVAAEEKAAASAKEGLGRRVREAEGTAQALADNVEELRLTLDRQRASAELREEGLQREVRDLEQRCQAAEARHQDLAANIPEATRPLLRQLEAMQASASANAQAWAAAEASLTARLSNSESAAAAAVEREKRAWEKLQASTSRMAATAAAIDTLKAELADAHAEVERSEQAQRAAAQRSSRAEEQLSQARQAEAAAQQRHLHLEHTMGEQLAFEQAQSVDASTAFEERIQALEQRLASQQAANNTQQAAAGDPPAMAAPGYRWQLVRSSDKASPSQAANQASTVDSSATSDKGSEFSYEPSSSQHSRLHTGTAGEVERLRTALRQKEDQIASLQSQLTNLEATRDSLAEEVIAAAGSEEAARAALANMDSAKQEQRQAQQQLLACTEMLGEKEERLEELRADLQDVKQLYKDQIEFMVEQLARLRQQQVDQQQQQSRQHSEDKELQTPA